MEMLWEQVILAVYWVEWLKNCKFLNARYACTLSRIYEQSAAKLINLGGLCASSRILAIIMDLTRNV
jgi:hypothetical protein